MVWWRGVKVSRQGRARSCRATEVKATSALFVLAGNVLELSLRKERNGKENKEAVLLSVECDYSIQGKFDFGTCSIPLIALHRSFLESAAGRKICHNV
jgi:hypothetical protein